MNKEIVELIKFIQNRQEQLQLNSLDMANFLEISEFMYYQLITGQSDMQDEILLHKIANKLDMRFSQIKKLCKKFAKKEPYKVTPTQDDPEQGFDINNYLGKKGRVAFTNFLEKKQGDLGFTNEQMANLLEMPIFMYKGFKDGYLEPPQQKLLHQIAEKLGMTFEELRPIAEKRNW